MRKPEMTQEIIVDASQWVQVVLRRVSVAKEVKGEVILDINRFGEWVRGFEIVGGFVPFALTKAVLPYSPIRGVLRSGAQGAVTYDPDADAAFFYLRYGPGFALMGAEERQKLQTVSHSVNPTAIYGLDRDGGLVAVRIPVSDLDVSPDFARLFAA